MGKYRMYSLVLRQLNPMQKGIQSAHSIVEYGRRFHKSSEYIQWVNVDKTIIVLDGGTFLEMKECIETLDDLKVPYSIFREEDLGNLITSISFLADERIWDSKSYPAYEEELDENSSESEIPVWLIMIGGKRNLAFRNFIMSKRLSA